MRSRRASISSCRVRTDGGTHSLSASSISPSPAHAREDVLEREQGLETGGLDERAPVDGTRVFHEIDRARRRVVEAEAEEASEDGARQRLGDWHGGAARLADGDLDRHRAGAGHVEDAV